MLAPSDVACPFWTLEGAEDESGKGGCQVECLQDGGKSLESTSPQKKWIGVGCW